MSGNETWKWGLVFVLLAVFLVTANHAYFYISGLDDFPPPDDYLMGDSWDLEHGSGPGAGQPMNLVPDRPSRKDPERQKQKSESSVEEIEEDFDWEKFRDVDDPFGER